MKESGEMYLESIYVLCSKPSVSRAVGLLKKDGYIEVDKDGYITLTNSGKDMANKIFERHTLLTKMLESLGVPTEVASVDACRMEHVISEETFNAMKKHFGN